MLPQKEEHPSNEHDPEQCCHDGKSGDSRLVRVRREHCKEEDEDVMKKKKKKQTEEGRKEKERERKGKGKEKGKLEVKLWPFPFLSTFRLRLKCTLRIYPIDRGKISLFFMPAQTRAQPNLPVIKLLLVQFCRTTCNKGQSNL